MPKVTVNVEPLRVDRLKEFVRRPVEMMGLEHIYFTCIPYPQCRRKWKESAAVI